MMKLINISKSYGKNLILNNVNITFPKTGHFVLLGENGSGKTTLLNVISKRLSYKGQIIYDDGFNIKDDLFYLYSENNFFPNLTVEENAKLLLNKEEINIFTDYLLKLEVSYIYKRLFKALSDGEKQKFGLILAFTKRAKLTLLDEPLAFIDKESKPLFREEINKLKQYSLVIESAPVLDMSADFVYRYDNKNFVLVKENKDLALSANWEARTKSKKFGFINTINLFKRKFSLTIILINVVALIFVLAITTLTRLSQITENDIFSSFYDSYSGTILYDKTNTLSSDYKRNVFQSSDIKTLPLEIKYSTLPESYPYDMSTSNNYIEISNLVESSNILIDGKILDIKENEIYISDYYYAVAYATSKNDTYELGQDDVIIPKILPETYDPNYIKLPKYDYFTDQFKIKIYKTNFEKYLPNFSLTEKEYKKQVEVFSNMVKEYFSFAFMTSHTITYFLNDYYVDFTDDLGNYFGKGFTFDDFSAAPSNTGKKPLASDEMVATAPFAYNILGLTNSLGEPISDDCFDKYYPVEFKYNGKSIVKNLKLIKDDYHVYNDEIYTSYVYISNDLVRELYDFFDLGNINSYHCSKDINIMLDKQIENSNLENYEFVWRDDYLDKLDYQDFFNKILVISLIIIAIIFVVIIALYAWFNIRNEAKFLAKFSKKGCHLALLTMYNYLVRFVLILLVIGLGIVVGIVITWPLATWFGILV